MSHPPATLVGPAASPPAACSGWRRTLRIALPLGLLLLLLLLPLAARWLGDSYLLALASRMLVFALAAVGLNLAMGFAGLVSLGHAMYLGLGAYGVLMLGQAGWTDGWLQLLLILIASGAIAAGVGWIALRTQGIAFIMITLAFAQLFYFLFVSLKVYGGDEGQSLAAPSSFGPLTGSREALYYALLALLLGTLYASWRLLRSRFGLVLRACRVNERRVRAVGTTPLAYRLTAYVLSAQVCALAGFFLANLSGFVSPAYLAWTVSGELIAMVVLGGVGSVLGPAIGALALLGVEELLKAWTEHWPVLLGPLIVLLVLSLRRGLWSLLQDEENEEAAP